MNRIMQLREEMGYSQLKLAMLLGVSQETISGYEMEKHYPTVKNLLKLREIFGTTIDYILGLSDNRYEIVVFDSLLPEETELLHMYRAMSTMDRERLRAYAQGYLDGSSKKS